MKVQAQFLEHSRFSISVKLFPKEAFSIRGQTMCLMIIKVSFLPHLHFSTFMNDNGWYLFLTQCVINPNFTLRDKRINHVITPKREIYKLPLSYLKTGNPPYCIPIMG